MTIIFSPISKQEFACWTEDHAFDASKPYMISQPYTHLAWETSKYGYQNKTDVTIFVDCNAHHVEEFDRSAKGDFELRSLLSFAVEELKAVIYRKALEGIFGICNVQICAFHPCEKLMFSMGKLLKHSFPEEDVYGVFCNFIDSQEEYHNTFRWIQSKYRWKINVLYGGIFEAYRMEVKDGGIEQNIRKIDNTLGSIPKLSDYRSYDFDMNGAGSFSEDWAGYLDACEKWGQQEGRKYENGQFYVQQGDEWITTDALKEQKRKMTNPSTDEIRQHANEMQQKLNDDIENRYKRRSDEITEKRNQLKGQNSWDRNDPDRQFFDKMRAEELEYIQSYSVASEQHQQNLAYAKHHGREEVAFEGKYVRDYDLECEQKKIEQEIEDRKEEIENILKMADDIDAAFLKTVLISTGQILLAIGSIFCPPLAAVDILITIVLWKVDESTSTKVTYGIGIGMDILGLLPYVGGAFKLGRIGTRLGQLAAKAGVTVTNIGKSNAVVKALADSTEETIKLGAKAKALGVLKDKILPQVLNPKGIKKAWNDADQFRRSGDKAIAKMKVINDAVADTWTKFYAIGYNGFLLVGNWEDLADDTIDAIATAMDNDISVDDLDDAAVNQMRKDIAEVLGCAPEEISDEDINNFIKGDDMSALLEKANPDKGVAETEQKKNLSTEELQNIYDEAEADLDAQNDKIAKLEKKLAKKGGCDPELEAEIAAAKQKAKEDEDRMKAAETAINSKAAMDEHNQKVDAYNEAVADLKESRNAIGDYSFEAEKNQREADKLKQDSSDSFWAGDMEKSNEEWAKAEEYGAAAEKAREELEAQKKEHEKIKENVAEARENAYSDEELWNAYGAEIDYAYAVDDLMNPYNQQAILAQEQKEKAFNDAKSAVQESHRKQDDIINERNQHHEEAERLKKNALANDWAGNTEKADELWAQAREHEAAIDQNNADLQKQKEEHQKLVQNVKDTYEEAYGYNTVPTEGTATDRFAQNMENLRKVDEKLGELGEKRDNTQETIDRKNDAFAEMRREEDYDPNSRETDIALKDMRNDYDKKYEIEDEIAKTQKERDKIVEETKKAYKEAYGEDIPDDYFDYDASTNSHK